MPIRMNSSLAFPKVANFNVSKAIAFLLLPAFTFLLSLFVRSESAVLGFSLIIIATIIMSVIPGFAFPIVLIGSLIDYLPLIWGSPFRFFLLFALAHIFTQIALDQKGLSFNYKAISLVSFSMVLLSLSVVFSDYPIESIKGSWNLNSGFLTFVVAYFYVSKHGLPQKKQWLFIMLNLAILFMVIAIKGPESLSSFSRLTISEGVNPNTLAISLVYSLCFVLGASQLLSNKILRVMAFGFFTIGFYALILTGSRTSVIALLWVFLFFIFSNVLFGKGFFFTRTIVVVSMLVFLLFFLDFVISSSPLLLQRFTLESVIQSHGTSRFDAWGHYLKLFSQQPVVFFTGLGASPEAAYSALAKLGMPPIARILPHNMYLQLVISFGIFGALLVLGFFISGAYYGIKQMAANKSILPFLFVLISLFVLGLGETVFGTKPIWLSLGAIFAQYSKTKNGI